MADPDANPDEHTPSDTPPVVTLAPDATGVGAGRAVLVLFAVFSVQIAVGLVFGVAATVYYMIVEGAVTPALVAKIERVVVLPASLLAVVASGLAALLVTFWGAWRGAALEAARRSIGLCGAAGGQVLAAAGLGFGLSASYVLLATQLVPADPHASWGPLATAANAGGVQRLLWALLAVVLAPPVEEFVFRGVLWAGLSRSLRPPLAAGLVTAIFVLVHVTEARGYWPAWLAITVLATATLATRVRAGSLLPPLALHVSYNLGLVTAVYLGVA